MLAMDVWCFSKSTIRVDLEKHQTRLHYWGNSLCNFEESPLQLWGILLYNKQTIFEVFPDTRYQRCTVHFYRNIFSITPRKKMKTVALMLKAIYSQKSKEIAREKVI